MARAARPVSRLETGRELTASLWTVAEGDGEDVLDRIGEPGIGLALWRRAQPRVLGRWLASSPINRLQRGRVLVRREEIAPALDAIVGPCSRPEARVLAADMAALAERFCTIADTPLVDIRVEALTHDGCWKFHADNVALRLIATCRGPGTQWVAAADGERALAEQRAYAGPVHEIPKHAVALFKGIASRAAVVHRSPPIAKSGASRLLLVLNLPSAASPPVTDFDG